MVIVNNQPGLFSGNLTLAAEFPVVSVGQEEGQAILDAAKAGQAIGITTPPTVGLTRSMNIVARASETSVCTVVVGGHFDSVPAAPGANDNASGTSNVLELARAVAVDGVDEGVCFVAFGAEESGLYGSKAFVAELAAEGFVPTYMINLDVTGIGTGVEVIGDSALADRAFALAQAAGIPVVPSVLPANSGSDHQSFAEAGIEVVFFSSGSFSTIHSPEDVIEDLEVEVLDLIGDAAYLTLTELLAEVAAG
jgi:Zn-dependent M28 family amino/carboxypeptidase